MGEKTEKATPKKLRDAKKKGQIAKSQDFPSAFTFIVSIWVTLSLATYLYNYLGNFIVMAFSLIPHDNLDHVIVKLFIDSYSVIFLASIPILIVTAFVGVVITFLAQGPVFAPEVFKFDIKKFDPVQNLKAKFKLKTLVELLKSILKISVACYLIYNVMYKSLPVLIQTVSTPIHIALMVLQNFLQDVIFQVGLFFIVVAVLDFAYQKFNFGKEMMMEKFEVKQEFKNSEGDPNIKSKRRQVAQEIAYSEGPTGGVRRAQAVVTNPTHIAVAIGYQRDVDAAPYIIAMGQDILAERIIKLAEKYNIPIIRNIKLAHKLWDEGEVYEFVPEESYEAIAEIMRWISSLETEDAFEYNPRE